MHLQYGSHGQVLCTLLSPLLCLEVVDQILSFVADRFLAGEDEGGKASFTKSCEFQAFCFSVKGEGVSVFGSKLFLAVTSISNIQSRDFLCLSPTAAAPLPKKSVSVPQRLLKGYLSLLLVFMIAVLLLSPLFSSDFSAGVYCSKKERERARNACSSYP